MTAFLHLSAWGGANAAQATWEYIARSPCHSIDKARTRLGYQPRYTSLEAVKEAVTALIADGKVVASK